MSEVWAGMASLLERAGSRTMAIESLLPQVDRMVITPGDERGCEAKFDACRSMPDDAVFLGVDDDLLYPPDYVEATLRWLDAFPGHIISYHGFTIDQEGQRDENYRCLDELVDPVPVHIVGSGVCAFRVSTIRPLVPDHFPIRNGADPWFALLAEQRGIPRVVVPHPDRWFGYTEWRRTMWTETSQQTGSDLDGSLAMRTACEQLVALLEWPEEELEAA